MHEYSGGRLPLYHLDLYRLEGEAAIRGAGLESYLYERTGITIIEWIDRWSELALEKHPPANGRYRFVLIEPTDEFERRITYEDFGA